MVTINRLVRTDSQTQRIDHISAARKADVAGYGQLPFSAQPSQDIKVLQKAIYQESADDKIRISLSRQAPEDE